MVDLGDTSCTLGPFVAQPPGQWHRDLSHGEDQPLAVHAPMIDPRKISQIRESSSLKWFGLNYSKTNR
jgi:hypothetical protein